MQKLFVSLTAVVITAATLAASTAPANALRRHVARPGPVGVGVYVAPARVVVRAPVARGAAIVVPGVARAAPRANWAAHVTYCSGKYLSYNPNTDTYVSSVGGVRTCL